MKCDLCVLFFLLIDVIYASVLSEVTTVATTYPNYTDSEDFFFQDKILRHQFTLPGTKYCGPGNRSNGPNDLGRFEDVDMCCRDHDMCSDNIPAGEYKHGLHNTASFTKSNCICDETFHHCLKDIHTVPSRIIGAFYFSLFHIDCYKKEHPVIECTRHRRRRCLEYRLNITATPVYQWFDSPFFRHWIEQFPNITVLNNTYNEYLAMSNDINGTDIPNKLIVEIDENDTDTEQPTTISSIYSPAIRTSKISIFDYLFPKLIVTTDPPHTTLAKLQATTIYLGVDNNYNINNLSLVKTNDDLSNKIQSTEESAESETESIFTSTKYYETTENTLNEV